MSSPFVRAALALVAVCLLPRSTFGQPPTDVGTLPGYTISRPKNINNRGDIVGQSAGAGPVEQATLWTRAGAAYTLEALAPLDGLTRSDAFAFARGETPVGFASLGVGSASISRAIAWRDDPSGLRVPVDLEPPPGLTGAKAFDANHHGMIVGEATNATELVNGSSVRHAVAWVPRRDGDYEVLDLGVPDGFDVSSASGVNEMGEIVGTARRLETDGSETAAVVVWRRPFLRHGVCYSDTHVLPSHPALPRNLSPSINTVGLVVAQANRTAAGQPTVSRALVWLRSGRGFSGPYELPVPAGFTDAYPSDVNEFGVVLGTAQVRGQGPIQVSRAVVWTWGRRGRVAAALLPDPAGTTLVFASHLNERGDVVGSTPAPPPGTSGGLIWKRTCWGRGSLPGRRIEPRPDGP